MTGHVKVLFRIETPGTGEVESLWATERDGGFALDNIPFYAREVAWGDVVRASKDAGGALWFEGLIAASGHSTVRLWFARAEDVANVRDQLRGLGCPSELSELPRLVAVDIPPEVSYDHVKAVLEEGVAARIFEYEEACLGFRQS